VDELGSRKEVEYAFKILEEGSSADRQIAVYEKSGGDIKAVVDHLIAETREGVMPNETSPMGSSVPEPSTVT
jgi:carboxylate-amine ligase